jgi:dihydrofolate reductase
MSIGHTLDRRRQEGEDLMSTVRFSLAISLDGYLAGPGQSLENPLGVGGLPLHDWAFPLAAFRTMHGLDGGEVNASTQIIEEAVANVGAVIMGRNMFGGHPGPWRDDPRGQARRGQGHRHRAPAVAVMATIADWNSSLQTRVSDNLSG